ncbi:wdr18 [Acrasis kona]|uniref:Wdr18 n=1 Tax=Acrasis kona TaxID=1008807 RepID=A0AAW2ZH99_9EUKA
MRDQQYLVCAQIDRPSISIYDIRREEPLYVCSLAEKITCVETYGKYCFGGSESGAIYVWDVTSGELIRRCEAHLRAIECIVVQNGFIVTGGSDTIIYVFSLTELLDVRTDPSSKIAPLHSITSHALSLSSIKVTLKHIISTSLDRTVKIHDLATATELLSITFPSGVLCVCVDSSEHIIRAGCANGNIYEVNLYPNVPTFITDDDETSEEQGAVAIRTSTSMTGTQSISVETSSSRRNKCRTYTAHTDAVNDISLTVDGRYMTSCSKDGRALVWDTRSGQLLYPFKKHMIGATDVEVSNSITVTFSMSKHVQKLPRPLARPFKKFMLSESNQHLVTVDRVNFDILQKEETFDVLTAAWHESRRTVAPKNSQPKSNDEKITKLKNKIKLLEETNEKQRALNDELDQLVHTLASAQEKKKTVKPTPTRYYDNTVNKDDDDDDEKVGVNIFQDNNDIPSDDYQSSSDDDSDEDYEKRYRGAEYDNDSEDEELIQEEDDGDDHDDDEEEINVVSLGSDFATTQPVSSSDDEQEEENDKPRGSHYFTHYNESSDEEDKKSKKPSKPIVEKNQNKQVEFKFNFTPEEEEDQESIQKDHVTSKNEKRLEKIKHFKYVLDQLKSAPKTKLNLDKSLIRNITKKRKLNIMDDDDDDAGPVNDEEEQQEWIRRTRKKIALKSRLEELSKNKKK